MSEEDDDNLANINLGYLSNIPPEDIKNKYVTLLQ